MTAKKLDFLMDLNGSKEPVKVRIYKNQGGVNVAMFDDEAFFPEFIAIEYLPEVIRVLQEVYKASKREALHD